jgi:transposase
VIYLWDLTKGKDFLSAVSLQQLRTAYDTEQGTKAKIRLLCAIHRKQGESTDSIMKITNLSKSTVHDVLHRFVERGLDGKDAIKQDGRPPKLTVKQRRKLLGLLDQGPPYNSSGLWTTKEVRELIRKKFGVEYTPVHVWELLQAAGFSIQKPRPRNYKAPSKWKMTHFKKRLQCWRSITGKKDLL